jgi:signal transduction histidine kinase
VSGAGALWPLALTVACVVGGGWARERRRRTRLNRALHELRRPLQALALASALDRERPALGSATLDLALSALAGLDGEINGTSAPPALRPVSARALVAAAVERWRGPAAAARHTLELQWRAGRATVLADPALISQALDNLLANALEHGGLRVGIVASICARGLRIQVANDLSRADVARRARDPRRGHGLRVAARVAAAHGGAFRVNVGRGVASAVLELPLAASPLAAAGRPGGGARRPPQRAARRGALAA